MASQVLKRISQQNRQFSTLEQRDEWLAGLMTVGEAIKPGSPVLQPIAVDALLTLYSSTLEEVGPERFEDAFVRVLETSPFRPDISEIRKAAGVGPDDEAMRQLGAIFAKMRDYDDWRLLEKPRSRPGEPAPTFDARTEAAIALCGLGERRAGLAMLAEHPALATEPDPYAGKVRNDVERRWCECYAKAA